jgi:cell division protein FtsQ
VVGTDTTAEQVDWGGNPGSAPERRRSSAWRRARNRRVAFQGRQPLVAVAEVCSSVGRRLLGVLRVLGKVVLAVGVMVGLVLGGRLAAQHVIASPRFSLREITVTTGGRVGRDEILALAGVAEGDRLLQVDPDQVALRVARHPWVARVRVRRQLPATLTIEVDERQAAAVAALGALYLVDGRGHPFKRATMDEAEGLPVLSGIARTQYATRPELVEAAFREGLALVDQYRASPERPALSEVNIDPRFGLTLFLQRGGVEVRLGQGELSKKLARLDQIFEAVRVDGSAASLRVVHLDGPEGARVPVRLAEDKKKD